MAASHYGHMLAAIRRPARRPTPVPARRRPARSDSAQQCGPAEPIAHIQARPFRAKSSLRPPLSRRSPAAARTRVSPNAAADGRAEATRAAAMYGNGGSVLGRRCRRDLVILSRPAVQRVTSRRLCGGRCPAGRITWLARGQDSLAALDSLDSEASAGWTSRRIRPLASGAGTIALFAVRLALSPG